MRSPPAIDDLDGPEPSGYDLVVPFVVCRSRGGPFDDNSFVAGFQCGEVYKALAVGAVANAETVRVPMAHTSLLRQFELMAMSRGYPVMTATTSEEFPEWSDVTFTRQDCGG